MRKLAFILSMAIFTMANAQTKQTLPDLTLKLVSGKNKLVSDYAKNGKITVISFWATWCTPCKKELSNLNELYDDWKAKYNFELVAVSTDDSRNVPKVKPFVDGQGWEFDCLLDVNQDLIRALNGITVPFTIMLDQNGQIVYSHSGYVEGDEFVMEEKIKALAAKK